MYRNQYFMVAGLSSPDREFAGMAPISLMDFSIYQGPHLNLSFTKYESVEILLLGYVIDPLNPERSDQEVIENLARTCKTQNSFFEGIQILSGRFVLVYRNESSFIALGDACSFKQMYFGQLDDFFVMTSSEAMFLNYFDLSLQMSSLKQQHVADPNYKKHEQAWFGDKGFDDRLFKVLPNHYLDLKAKEVKRIPYFSPKGNLSEDDIINFASSVLKGTFAALINRGLTLKLALTAGLDSRVLLAASKDFKDKIEYFRFNHKVDAPDTIIPSRLAQTLGLNYEGLTPKSLNDTFLAEYKQEHIIPPILTKTTHIQHYYYHWQDRNYISINGGANAVAKTCFGIMKGKVSLDMLVCFSNYATDNEFVRSELKAWLEDAADYSESSGVPLLDLFYWEQRLGNWGADQPFQKDIAIEEICPCNNRSLIAHLLLINPSKRLTPNYEFFRKLIQSMWPEVLTEPINPGKKWPGEKRFKSILKRNSALNFAAKTAIYKTKKVFQS
ncbi:hypothetical protein [Leptolyngbya sp. FACHB-16]|uniref:hypothetical protein n=1 Tax=unclassified Leptolyngbya TaxID=2650499 RepID=UPI001686FFF2|nr:hypothetical protein [Leptolyngbya sp. FACHB-16]MBD2158158.1 hypothetical protein [Leptolyngbya sp. FACHB-16]